MKISDFKIKGQDRILEIEDKSVPLLYFPILENTGIVEHCFTTRAGGVSEGIFDSLNLSFTRGDDESAVMENYDRLAAALDTRKEQFVCTDQTHTTNVIRVGKEDCGYGVIRQKPYTDVDGLVTDEPGVVLSTFFADCVPLYFVDTVNRAIGLSHSGWRGTAKEIVKKAVNIMVNSYGIKKEDILCAIGPSISQCCFEVSKEVIDEITHINNSDICYFKKENGKYQLDLKELNKQILLNAGVKEENIDVCPLCTKCEDELFYSYRREGEKAGRNAGFVML